MEGRSGLRDAELIAAFRGGDEDAFRELCDRHAERLQSRIRRQLSPAILRKLSAADILQDAYLTALRKFADFEDRGDGSFGRWLGAIVEHKVRHAVRRLRGTEKRGAVAEVSRGHRPDTVEFAADGASPSQVAMSRELRERIREAVALLSPDHREVIRLRQEEHLTVRETAERLGRSPDAVKMLHGRALKHLARLLDVPGSEP